MTTMFLPDGYVSRTDPIPFDDRETTGEWQPGAYALALDLARRIHPASVLDIGCGNARKLVPFADVAPVYVCDTPPAIAALWDARWIKGTFACDLEKSPLAFVVPRRTLIVCCDVIEHLRVPGHLLRFFAHQIDAGSAVVLSTPDRDLAGCAPLGPPYNRSHVREWSMAEFQRLCDFYGLVGGDWSHTQTVTGSDACHTITAVYA